MKIKTFHMKISSVRENENFNLKCEILGFLVYVEYISSFFSDVPFYFNGLPILITQQPIVMNLGFF